MSVVLLASSEAFANDLVRTTVGASGIGAGGVALLADDPLAAMSNNPALLAGQGNSIQIGGHTVSADGRFTGRVGQSDTAKRGPGVLPEIAFTSPVQDTNMTLGGSVYLRSALRADFDFFDTPGTGGVSYGQQRHFSEHIVLQAALGAGFDVSERLSVGASIGLLYNRNQLQSPYIFQTHPLLNGLKVLVDLEADDIAASASLGVRYQLSENLRLGLAFTKQSDFNARGELTGNLAELGLGIQPDFAYQANVTTASPASVSASVAWQVSPRLAAGAQVDWVDWSEAFDELPITLTEGSNTQLNQFLDSDSILDTAPLNWSDQVSYRLGIRYELWPDIMLSAGMEFNEVPVPEVTFTPMTGAILDRSFMLGASLPFRDGRLDIGYRYSTGSDFGVDMSRLAGGEYSGSRLALSLHALVLSYRF